MDRLSILILHSLGDPSSSPAFLNNHVFSLRNSYPNHDYLYHDTSLNLPSYIDENFFDAIILDVTFLAARWTSQENFQSLKNIYSFVKNSSAVKIAFPQDEYDCNILLDDWMCEWNVDILFSVINSNWEILYPKYCKKNSIRLGYTGYIDESQIDRPTKEFKYRLIDIGYRAKKLPPYFGRIGENKWVIGQLVKQLGTRANLNVDIELGDQGTLLGEAWLNFIQNSKFTLGANSGSSLLDPTGSIQRAVRAHLISKPNATFEEIESICFPGLEGLYNFTAISPRVLEAAVLDSAQILVDGSYSNIIKPYEHFIPIRADASNFNDVHESMSNYYEVSKMIKRCREAILSVDALRYRNAAKLTLELIGDFSSRKNLTPNRSAARISIARYNREMTEKYYNKWRMQKFKSKVANCVRPFPGVHSALRSISQFLS